LPTRRHNSAPATLPNDDALINYINSCSQPPRPRDVARAFHLDAELRPALLRRLRDLAESGQLIKKEQNSARQVEVLAEINMPEISVLEILGFDDDGNGYARPVDDDANDIDICVRLNRREGRAPAIGQQILARLTHIGLSHYEARIIRVLDRQPKRIFGMAIAIKKKTLGKNISGKNFILQPATRRKRDQLNLVVPADMNITDGDLVEAILQSGRERFSKSARVIANLGNSTQSGAFSALAIAEFNIRHEFPETALRETQSLKTPPVRGRRDLRKIPFVTIDGADARDFDDAVYAEPIDHGGWRLMVAIADVSYYVRPGSALDLEAQLRGNSVYLPDRVVPMLPEAISNDLCSLRPHEDRATMVADMIIDQDGQRKSYKIERAIITSHARLTYDQVQAVYDGTLDEADCAVPHGTLRSLFGAWRALTVDREKRAPLALNLKERRVIMAEDDIPIRIEQRAQNEAQRLIEDFMITANVAAAEQLITAKKLCVFRVHDTPDPKKAASLTKLAEAIGSHFTVGQILRPRHFNQILQAADGTADITTINEAVLRSQAKAVYSVDNIGHFGLALRNYAHFTSPIRRYADLLVHRALNDAASKSSQPKDGFCGMLPDQIAKICTHISETEANAAAAERRTIDRFAAALFETRMGETVCGIIVATTSFGAFVRIDDGAADGFLPLNALPDDFYYYHESAERLEGQHNGWVFDVGDELKVKIVEVTAVSGGILLNWVDGGKIDKGSKQKQAARHGRSSSSASRKNSKKQRSIKSKRR
jgi:ribonuclease R